MPYSRTIRLGNIWLLAATVARSILPTEERDLGFPFVVRIDDDGTMTAIGQDHPDYERAALDPARVCVADSAMSVERFAGRLRAAMAGRS